MSILGINSRSPIGLDIGSRMIKAVQFGRARGRRVVTASVSIARARPGETIDRDEVQRLSRVLSQQGFAGRQVVISAPGEHLMASVIDMPPRDSGAPYDLIASQEFARLQSQEPGQFEVAWWDIPQPARSSSAKVMAVGCAHVDTDPVLDLLIGCGFDVSAMDSGMCAAARACGGQIGSPENISAVLDLGWYSSRLGLIHGGVVVFDRTLSGSGMEKFHDRVSEALHIEPAEADCLIQSVGMTGDDSDTDQAGDGRAQAVAPMLRPVFASYFKDMALDLEASFEYASHQYPDAEPHRLVLIGGGGAVPGLGEYLNTLIDPEVMSADTSGWGTTDGAPDANTAAALMATAQGLAGYYDQD
jgi:Tfp pilus assembly PilM family ATPase